STHRQRNDGRDIPLPKDRRHKACDTQEPSAAPGPSSWQNTRGGPAMTSHAIFQKADLSALKDPRLFREFAYVGGAWTRGTAQDTIIVTNPADGTRVGSVPALSASDTAHAIDVAQQAFGPWAAESPIHRSVLLRRWHDLILAARDDLARLMVLEQGKPFS